VAVAIRQGSVILVELVVELIVELALMLVVVTAEPEIRTVTGVV
jgi:hypothetical protein